MLDDFLAKYRKGDIVYPSAVARYLGYPSGNPRPFNDRDESVS